MAVGETHRSRSGATPRPPLVEASRNPNGRTAATRLVLPLVLALALACGVGRAEAQQPGNDPPRVVRLAPANGAIDLDPSEITEILVEFDRPMQQSGYSFCGGGPTFPQIPTGARPYWRDPKTCVLPVTLAHDHTYQLSINCPAAQAFRSAKGGVPVVPVPWTFSTSEAKPLSPKEQRELNERSLDELFDVLESSYSYYDRLDLDWKKLRRKHERKIVGAKSTRAWATEVGETLAAAEDLHLWLRIGAGDAAQTIGTASRSIDPLFRKETFAKRVEGRQLGNLAFAGRLRDEPRIGYLLIAGFTEALDLDGIEEALPHLAANCDAVIVDVRPNSGGDELLARRVAAWFLGPDEVVYAKNRYRTGPGDEGFGDVLDRTIRGRDEGRIELPVALLTSRYVMSSCEAFVLMMRQDEHCVTVGQPTYGASGNPKPHELSNGVTVFVPSWQAMRPDGTCFEGEGIAPDVLVDVDPKDLERGEDPILDRAIEVLKDKLGG
jgi:hypothetical protein